jgi:putative tryptophan/tyrosine transport system substrate-binding protein
MLADRGNPSSPLALRETQEAANALGITIKDYWIASADEFGPTLAAMKSDGIGGFIVAPGALFFAQRKALASHALEHRLPSMPVRREYAEAGCLMAYGSPISDNYRQAADYVAQILGGAKPAELAIGQPTEFEFIVNLRTADALGLTLPPSLIARAEKI